MQYLEVSRQLVPAGTEWPRMEEQGPKESLTREQQLLAEVRDKLCGGNAAELARRIGKDATYVNRLFYPEGKRGRKGIGLGTMQAVNIAFGLPRGFWDRDPPAIDDETMAGIRASNARHEQSEQARRDLDRLVDSLSTQILDGRVRQPSVTEPVSNYSTLQPIRAWEHSEDLPEGEFAMVPLLNVKLSAGPGSGVTQLQFDFDDGQLRAYSADWIRKHRLKPNKLRVMKGSGRSMEPTIFDGDDLLINLAQTDVVDGKVYALWYEGGERVKRLFRMPGGGLRIRSDNERDFPEIVLGPEYMGHVRVIGRVIDRSGPGGL